MLADLNSFQLILLIMSALLGHGLLAVGSRVVNPLYILASVILVLAPFSMAPDLGAIGILIRWLRGYCLVLLVVIGLFKYHQGAIRTASQLWLAFAAVYVLSSVWSTVPLWALRFKVQYGLVVVAGVLLAASTRDRQELIRGLRFMAVASGIVGLLVLAYFLLHSGTFLVWGRPKIFGVVATRVASNFLPLALVCIYLALNDQSRLWKSIAYVSSAALVAMILLTLSRSPTALVILGFLVMMMPRGGRRVQMLLLAAFVVVTAIVVFEIVGSDVSTERLISIKNTRADTWWFTAGLIAERPLIGHGWIPGATAINTFNAHSVFLQTSLEMGLLGLAFLCSTLLVLSARGVQMFRSLQRQPGFSQLAILPICLLITAGADGVFQSHALLPSSLALLMAFSICLVDYLPTMRIQETARVTGMMALMNSRRRRPETGDLGHPASS